MIYLDNNATTRIAPEVFEAMQPYLTEHYGNPSSAHSLGRKMKAAVERAREQVAELIGAAETSEIVFTSCGSESDNWAIGGFLEIRKRHIHIRPACGIEAFEGELKTSHQRAVAADPGDEMILTRVAQAG